VNRPSGSKGPDKKRTEAQQRLAELRAEQARKERRQKMLVIGVSVAAAAVIIGVVVGVLLSRDSTKDAATNNGPSISAGQPFIPVGKASAPVVVDVYEDMQCPACAQFEPTFETFIKPYMDRGDVRVNTHVVSFLDRASTNQYSSRAGNAVVCAADVSEDAFTKYKAKLYAEQPAEGGGGSGERRTGDQG
jgi:protein-disulfide isomerase